MRQCKHCNNRIRTTHRRNADPPLCHNCYTNDKHNKKEKQENDTNEVGNNTTTSDDTDDGTLSPTETMHRHLRIYQGNSV